MRRKGGRWRKGGRRENKGGRMRRKGRRQGEEGRRLVFSPSDREMAPPSERERDSRVSLSWGEVGGRGVNEQKERNHIQTMKNITR